jgi:hypothetical protein
VIIFVSKVSRSLSEKYVETLYFFDWQENIIAMSNETKNTFFILVIKVLCRSRELFIITKLTKALGYYLM